MTELEGKNMSELDEPWDWATRKARRWVGMEAFPLWTRGDSWVTGALAEPERGILPHDGSWMVGDLPSILWFLASGGPARPSPGDQSSAVDVASALRWSRRLSNRTGVRSFASVSHMFFRGGLVPLLTHGAEDLRPMVTAAAKTIADRFQAIGYMKSFGTPDDTQYPFTTIDDVINLCVPFWYARETGDEDLAARLDAAADLIGQWLVRNDGSTIQVLRFDGSGTPAAADTYQGESVDGCWSRGLAWGIYGFASFAALSGSARHVELAQRMADYWIDRVQGDPSPVWDFAVPVEADTPRDTFAAALAYAGLLELAALSDEPRARELVGYVRDRVIDLSSRYVVGHEGLGILRGAALDVPHDHGVGHDAAVIVGDSYYVEALWRLRGARTAQPLLTVAASQSVGEPQ